MTSPVRSPSFTVTHRSATSAARTGILRTTHGEVSTPCFMPIATIGAIHHVAASEMRALGAELLLANTYHLVLRPGAMYLATRGGIQRFMGWDGPVLTDSGGFQVFSLGARERRGGERLVAVDDDGVTFQSHLDGSRYRFTPELAIEYQQHIGSDIAMVLDVCPPQPCTPAMLDDAVRRTTAWAQRSVVHADRIGFRERALLFGIVQGGSDHDRRRESAAAITSLPFDGFAVGGVAVGEPVAVMRETVSTTAALLPEHRPRYLMGVGTPADIVHAVACGVDCFDCVLPTRDGRHGRAYRWRGERAVAIRPSDGAREEPPAWYETINVSNERFRDIDAPIDGSCECFACRHHTLAYLRHLFAIGEPLGPRLLTLHNLSFYFTLMRRLRASIQS